MSFVKDFLVSSGLMAVGLEASRRKDVRDYAALLGISEAEAAMKLDEAVDRLASERAHRKAGKAQRLAEAREAIANAKGFRARFREWAQYILREGAIAKREAEATHR